MRKIWGEIKKPADLINIFLILLISPLFFYKLGQSSLVSWDEAWYASIARNILISGDYINTYFNGVRFSDHPPFGFWLMAISFKFFGVNDFSARLPSALCGIISLVIVYLLGKKLFNRLVGFSSAVALSSAMWFLYRSRSGNLDIPLTMLFLLSILLSFLSLENRKYLYALSLSLIALFLTKTMVPFIIFPTLFVIFLNPKALKLKDFIYPVLIFLILIVGWFTYHILTVPNYLSHYLSIGAKDISVKSDYLSNIKLTLDYLHNGIGKWYWPGVLAITLGIVTRQKRFLILSLFCLTYLLPFVFTPHASIWYLVPLYPFLILSFFGLAFFLSEKFLKSKKYFLIIPLLFFCAYLFFNQTRANWYQFININAFVSDEAILSKEAGKFPEPLFIDDDFVPAAHFYSNKIVTKIFRGDINNFFKGPEKFLFITNDWRLEQSHIPSSSYKVIKKDRDKVLVLHN